MQRLYRNGRDGSSFFKKGLTHYAEYLYIQPMKKITSQRQLAEAVGTTPSNIGNLIKGRQNAPFDLASKISKALGSRKIMAWMDSTRWEERAVILDNAIKRNKGM